MSRGGFHTITLGCKLNQFDSAAIEAELLVRGLTRETDPARASVVVINTCTVTSRADADARKLIRRVRRVNPRCRLLVTGCYAELDPNAVRAAGEVDRVVGNRAKPELGSILDELGIGAPGDLAAPHGTIPTADGIPGDRGCDGLENLPRALHFGDRSRAFLKVQEGCDLVCSYCVIPQVRGPSRSVAPAGLERAIGALADHGYREVVLTGVNTGDYGRDLTPQITLRELLERLLASGGGTRIRLNSLEPRTVTDEVVELMASERRLAPHLQVPLQSGCDDVLRRMRRNYRAGLYRERLDTLRSRIPDIGLGADVIVGFPGETESGFRETERFIADSPLSYLHVFSWSPRPGTRAAEMDGVVPPSTVRERSARLRELGAELSFRFRSGFEGRVLDALVLADGGSGRARALSGNFIEVEIEGAIPPPGELVPVVVTRVTRESTHGRPLMNSPG